MIQAENLVKKFDDLTAVNNVSLNIKKGEAFGLLGPNGAGKSTTINMLSGILKPDSGKISINGIDDPSDPNVRLQFGNAPQEIALYGELTGEENLAFYGRLYGYGGNELKKRVEQVLELIGLTDRRKGRAKTYSGGMQRRLNLGCALVHRPPVLFLDEPTVGVDPQSRNLIFSKIEELKEQGQTILYTTHYMEEAERFCDRVGIIDHGQLLDIDTVDNLIKKHGGKSLVEIEFVSLPENVSELPGKLDGSTLKTDTDDPIVLISQLSARGLEFSRVNINRANLEAVFLNLTGRRLRD